MLAVVGNSGSGKSSLIRAGLIPALRRGHFHHEGSPVHSWRVTIVRPSVSPFDYLAEALPSQLAPELTPIQQLDFIAAGRAQLPGGGDALRDAISALAGSVGKRAESEHILLVVDQFEELFTLVQDQATRQKYIDLLLGACRLDSAVPVHLLLALRADFYANCLEHANLSRSLALNQYNVPRMSSGQLGDCICKRLTLAGASAEPGLIEALLADVGDEPGDLALLEHALGQLWEKQGGAGRTLTNRAYAQIGRLRGSLGQHADEVYGHLADQERQVTQRIFLELVHLGEGAEDTRRRVEKQALLNLGGEQAGQLLAKLASSRLIATGAIGEQTFVEVSHEALIRAWPRLREWLSQNREDLRLERRLGESAEEWQELNRDPGTLLQGLRLAEAEEWLQKHPETPDSLREFVRASGAARAEAARKERETQERTRRSAIHFRWLSYSLAVLLMTIGVLVVIAQREKHNVEAALVQAEVQDGIRLMEEGRSDQAAAFFARALRSAPDSLAATNWLSDLLLNQDWWVSGAPLQHSELVWSVAFSPDGRRVVTASADKTARVWEAETGKPVSPPLQHQGKVNSVRFSPDGRRVVSASDDHTARVWEAETGEPASRPLRHQGNVYSATFSPDGRRVITASYDKTARVWEADTSKAVSAPLQHQTGVLSVAFSPDGRCVVTGSADHTARVWDTETGKPLGAPLQHQGIVWSATFSPDGRRVATASADRTARVWEAEADKDVGVTLQHQGVVLSKAFSPDGRRVVTASADHTAQVWEAETGKPVSPPLQHQGPVYSATFSPDGRLVVTASADRTARVWEAVTGKAVGVPMQHQGGVLSVAFSPDGRRVVTASADHTARVWEAATGEAVGAPLQHQGGVLSVAFSPDGRRVVTASEDNTARVWEAETGKAVGAPLQHQRIINSATFSPEGHRVVTASWDNTARVWNAETSKPLSAPMQHQGGLYSATFSPDGRRVVTASWDNTARVWDAETGKAVGAPMQHQGPVYSATFSREGRRVVTASADHTARVWEAKTGEAVGAPLQHRGWVLSATFSPDGRHVLTASRDGTARVWALLLICCSSQEEANRLASLAEAVSGNQLAESGSLSAVNSQERLQELIRESGNGPAPELSLNWIIRHFETPK